jgi:hypothetical protein
LGSLPVLRRLALSNNSLIIYKPEEVPAQQPPAAGAGDDDTSIRPTHGSVSDRSGLSWDEDNGSSTGGDSRKSFDEGCAGGAQGGGLTPAGDDSPTKDRNVSFFGRLFRVFSDLFVF